MNALDQAFIKAFAKDRAPGAIAARRNREVHARPQPPADGVESVSLVLHDLYQQGKRLRIDRPAEDNIGLDAHMIFPLVEHVESYHLADVLHARPPVVFEDRLTPLDQTDRVRLQRIVDDMEPESNVKKRTEAIGDKEVPTLDLPAVPPAVEEQDLAEERLLAECLPHVLLAAPQLAAPGLMTRELGQLGAAVTPTLESATSAVEISLPYVDLDALAALASQPPARGSEQDVLPNAVTQVDATPAETGSTVVVELNLGAVESPAIAESLSHESLSHAVERVARAECPAPLEVAPTPADGPPAIPMACTTAVDPTECSFTAELPSAAPWDDELAGGGSEVSQPTPTVDEDAASVETKAAEAASVPPEPFTPAWEVDAFRWPALCLQLDERTDGRLTESGAELFVATRDGLKVLAVTSSCRLEGRSSVALSLARSAAKAGCRVALVDADAANPELARRLGMEAPCDWCEVVRRGEPLSEAAVASLGDGVTLFPRTVSTEDAVHLLEQSLSRTLGELGRHFDLVIVDLPPETPGETPANGRAPCAVDMAVVVRNVRTTSQQQCLATVAALRQQGVRAVGVIENFTHTENSA